MSYISTFLDENSTHKSFLQQCILFFNNHQELLNIIVNNVDKGKFKSGIINDVVDAISEHLDNP